MPDAPANAAPSDTANITYTDNHLTDLHQSVASNLKQAGAPVPFEAVKPIHVPDARPENIVDEQKVQTDRDMPGSFNTTPQTALSPLKVLSEHLDYADQLVTGRSHVVDEAHRFAAHKNEKEDKRLQYINQPKSDKRGVVKKFVDWLHDEKAA